MMNKIALVNELVANGYHLMGESIESFAERFDIKDLQMFLECFKNRIK